jgi:hypothetical protein
MQTHRLNADDQAFKPDDEQIANDDGDRNPGRVLASQRAKKARLSPPCATANAPTRTNESVLRAN